MVDSPSESRPRQAADFVSLRVSFSTLSKKVREKSRESHNHKSQPFPDPKRKRKPTNLNKHKQNKRTKSTKISSLFPKRGNRNTKRTEKHKNKMTHGKTYNKSPHRINRKATKRKTNTGKSDMYLATIIMICCSCMSLCFKIIGILMTRDPTKCKMLLFRHQGTVAYLSVGEISSI